MFVNDKDEIVHAYQLPPGRPPLLEQCPTWLQDAALWSDGSLRIALHSSSVDTASTTKLVISTADRLLEVSPGDWIVWLYNNEGVEFESYDDVEFTRRFARTDH